MNERASQQPGVLAERLASPGLLLALLGQDAMRRLRAAHTAVGVTPRQFQLLGLLQDNGPLGQRELGETMGIDPSVVVTLLNPLEESGFVTRRRDAADRRRHIVLLTDAGTTQLTEATRAQREAEDVLFAGLGDEQREQLRQLLLALQRSIAPAPETGMERDAEARRRESPARPHRRENEKAPFPGLSQ